MKQMRTCKVWPSDRDITERKLSTRRGLWWVWYVGQHVNAHEMRWQLVRHTLSHLLAPPDPKLQTLAAARAFLLQQVSHQSRPPALPFFLVLATDFLQQWLQTLNHLHDDEQRSISQGGLLVRKRSRVESHACFLWVGSCIGLAAFGFRGACGRRSEFALPAQFAERDGDAAVADRVQRLGFLEEHLRYPCAGHGAQLSPVERLLDPGVRVAQVFVLHFGEGCDGRDQEGP